jgi:(heptosyl)LPS beta-1,4-glucosyltransferase
LTDIVEEVLILDSGSTDAAEAVAREFSAHFISVQWKGYAQTKNIGNELANTGYILSMDADEVLSPGLRESIQKEKDQLSGAYSFNRLTNYAGTWIRFAGWYPDRKIRLFPKGQASWEGDFVHEKLVLNDSVELRHLNGDLLHYSFQSSIEHKQREKKYARLAAEQDRQQGKLPRMAEAYLKAFIRFMRMYFFQRGFLHGRTGFVLCSISARGKIWRYRYLVDAIGS